MAQKTNYNYLREHEDGYPKIIYWKVIAPKGIKLNSLMDHDIVFDERDMKIRGLLK